ncbi:MAG: BREX-1 system phosphatase PglZ type A [Caulobacterales bacterium]|nr:BREX-1 system phosphatase PglZ type A [Caulobacterales bacterium]
MNPNIIKALEKQFKTKRIVFWYDETRELQNEFDECFIDGVEKLVVANNEFGVKYRILHEQPNQKFIIYRPHPRPNDIDNWLLDVELWSGKLQVDEVGLLLDELGMQPTNDNAALIRAHNYFFKAQKRMDAFKAIYKPNKDDDKSFMFKMLGVIVGSKSHQFDYILRELFNLLPKNDDGVQKLIIKSGLGDFLWKQLDRIYGYQSPNPSIKDFAIFLFRTCFDEELSETNEYTDAKKVFLDSLKTNTKTCETFKSLSEEYAEILGIKDKLADIDYKKLVTIDYYRLIENKIIYGLIKAFMNNILKINEFRDIKNNRKTTIWFDDYQTYYDGIESALEFDNALSLAILKPNSFDDGINKYCENWYYLDQTYRKFILAYQSIETIDVLKPIFEQIEKKYNNSYLHTLCDNWQVFVNSQSQWNNHTHPRQHEFFNKNIKPIIDNNKKIYVIISDAFRYEIGEELKRKIIAENRFDASIEPMISSLPSYTQLGMASLLPNENLAFKDDGSGTILADGMPTNGTENRNKILSQFQASAILAKEVLEFTSEQLREIMKANQCLYIYHNQIDFTGDKRETEKNVFKATEAAIDEIIAIIKKLSGNNANNIIVTADHGFLFQYSVQDTDFLSDKANGGNLLYEDRRFVIGKNLSQSPSFKHYSEQALGLDGELEVLIPNSLNRLLRKGSGARFVHGGASLQEIIVPLVRINKKRQDDIGFVDIEVIGKKANITSGQFSVIFYQTIAVNEKIKPRKLSVGLYSHDGKLLSNVIDIIFDIEDSETRNREISKSFVLNQTASEYNKQEVYLVLKEDVDGTNSQKEYKRETYKINRSIGYDMDF